MSRHPLTFRYRFVVLILGLFAAGVGVFVRVGLLAFGLACGGAAGFRLNALARDGVDDADQRVAQHLVTELVALPHDRADPRFGAFGAVTLVLHGLVQHGVEIFAFGAERRQAEP